jgi:hypothetical protein
MTDEKEKKRGEKRGKKPLVESKHNASQFANSLELMLEA